MINIQYFIRMATASIALGICVSASADIVHMRNGQKQAGVPIAARTNGSQVTLRTTAGEITIPRSRIDRVQAESPSASWTRLGDEFASSGNLEKALEAYQMAVELDSSNSDAQAKLSQARAGNMAQAATVQAAGDSRAQRNIQLAVDLARSKRFDEAASILQAVQPTEGSPLQEAYRNATIELNLLWGVDRLDRQDTAGAAEKLNRVLDIDPNNQQARQQLVKTFEGDPTKLEDMATFYLKSTDPAEQLKGADSLYKLRRFEEALPIYLKFIEDPQQGRMARDRAILILDSLHQQFASQGDYARALHYFHQYLQLKPDASAAPYSKYSYMVKRAQTNLNDPASRFELAVYAEELGLIPTAEEEFKNVLIMSPEFTSASEALKAYAVAHLADAQAFYNQAQYNLAIQKSQEVLSNYTQFPDVTQQAQSVQARAQQEQAKLAQNAKQQAIALAQRGDDYYNQAQQYFASYVSENLNTSVRIFSPRNEAAKFYRQAIFTWQTALQLDSSLGAPTSFNLYFKIADATAKYQAVANRRPPPMPRRDLNRSRRNSDSPGAV